MVELTTSRAIAATRAQRERRWPPPVPRVPSAEHALKRHARTRGTLRYLAFHAIALLAVALIAIADSPVAAAAEAQRSALSLTGADGMEHAPALTLQTDVRMHISGVIARVDVVQHFLNSSTEWVDGVYVLPLPENATVDALRIDVAGRITRGEVRERQRAEQAYQQARESGKRATLVDQHRPNLFRARIANIGPGEHIEITVGYLQLVEQHAGEYRVRVPLAITPRYQSGREPLTVGATADQHIAPEDASVNPPFAPPDPSRHRVSVDVMLDAGVSVQDLRSHFHEIDTTDLGGRYQIRLTGNPSAPDRDFELSWRPVTGTSAEPAVFLEDAHGKTHALLVLMPPQSAVSWAAARELIFVIDTSGSMQGESIAQAKAALLHALATLDDDDAFNVVQFNSATESLHLASVPASARNKRAAAEYVMALRADGGTEMRPALEAAFKSRALAGLLRQIVFITDGAVGNERSLFETIEHEIGDARLFTIGIGSAPNGHFMRIAARAGRGTHTLIGSTDQVAERMAELIWKIEQPVVTDVEIVWPAGVTAEPAPAIAPDLYAGEPLVITARLTGTPQGVVTVTGRDGSGAWVRQIPLETHSGRHEGIAGAWARRRIDELLSLERARLSSQDLRASIVQLALDYQVTTPYTSLVAIAPEIARPGSASARAAHASSTLPQGMAQAMALNSLPNAGTHAPLHLTIGLIGLLLALMSGLAARRLGA